MKIDPVFIKAVAFLLIAILIACLFSKPRCEGFKGEVKVHNLKSFGHDSKAWFGPKNYAQHYDVGVGSWGVLGGAALTKKMLDGARGQHVIKQTDVTPVGKDASSTLTQTATDIKKDLKHPGGTLDPDHSFSSGGGEDGTENM